MKKYFLHKLWPWLCLDIILVVGSIVGLLISSPPNFIAPLIISVLAIPSHILNHYRKHPHILLSITIVQALTFIVQCGVAVFNIITEVI